MAKRPIRDDSQFGGVSEKAMNWLIDNLPSLDANSRAEMERIIAEGLPAGDKAVGLQSSDPGITPRKLLTLAYDGAVAALLADAQHGVLTAIRGTGFALSVIALDTGDDEMASDFRAYLEEQQPAGVLLIPPLSEIRALGRICEALGFPHVGVGAAAQENDPAAIVADDRAAAAEATAYLIALGHERIGMVTGPDDSRLSQERELGYLDAMADHDLDRGPALIATGDLGFRSGYLAGRLLLEVSPRPTAIFAGNDEMAAGVLYAAAEYGIKVPDHLSVLGFDDTPLASGLYPQLSTVHVPLAEMTRAAAERLLSPGEHKPNRFTAQLVKRASTGPAPT